MDKQNPKLIDNRTDLKSLTFQCLSSGLDILKSDKTGNISIDSETNVIVITNFGTVEGTLIDFNKSTDNPNKAFVNALFEKVFEVRNERIIELENENDQFRLINDTDSLTLENVTITPYANSNNKFNLGELILFSDQIVGLSIGKIRHTN